MNRRACLRYAGVAVIGACVRPLSAQAPRIDAMRFSALQPGARLPDELKPWGFAGRVPATRYALVADEGAVVLRADAQASASGIVRELRFRPQSYPRMSWRWKVMNLVDQADLRKKEGDDFPARVYVTFDADAAALPASERMKLSIARLLHGDRVPAAALCYVWDGKSAPGTFVPNAYTDRVMMVVAEGGASNVGRWVRVERNLVEDFRRAFGVEPPEVTGVIVSSDTDNTGEKAVAYYGDISFAPS